jgi:hypothetical protein
MELGEGVLHALGAGLRARVLAEEVVVVGRRQRGVAVRRADHAELEGVRAQLLLELQPELESAAGVLVLQHLVLFALAQVEVALVPGAVVGELVVGGQERVRLAVALDLGHLVERLPLRPGLRIFLTQRSLCDGVDLRKHDAVRKVAVVGDSEYVAAGLVLVGLQELPQIFRIGAALRGVGGGRDSLPCPVAVVTVDHHAVQVLSRGDL